MATGLSEPTTELVEAVIISGPKKGAIVQVRDDNNALSDDCILTPEEERAFDDLQAQAERTLESLREAVLAARGLADEARSIRREFQNGVS